MKKICLSICFTALSSAASANGLSSANEQSSASISQQDKDLLVSTFTDAVPVSRPAARFPRDEALRSREGWVRLSYVVSSDGSVVNPVIEDSSGIRGFERSALVSLEKWQFEPAKSDGKPVEQAHKGVFFLFTMDGGTNGATRKFYRQFRNTTKLIEEKNFAEAEVKLKEMKESEYWNMYEEYYFHTLSGRYYFEQGNKAEALKALRKTIPDGKKYIKAEYYQTNLADAFKLALSTNHLSEAIRYGKMLIKEKPETQEMIAPMLAQIDAAVASEQLLVKSGTISQHGNWYSGLLRNHFTLQNINGELESLDIRCNNKHHIYQVEQQAEWKLPESWDRCSVYVRGKEGASFELVELPKKA